MIKGKKVVLMLLIGVLIIMNLGGCGSNSDKSVADLEGKWNEVNCVSGNINSALSDMTCDAKLSIQVDDSVDDDSIKVIIDDYWKNKFKNGEEYNGLKVDNCYVVVYKRNSYEVRNKIKYCAGKVLSIEDEEEQIFESIISYDKMEDSDDE